MPFVSEMRPPASRTIRLPSGDIPRFEVELPKAVEPAARNEREIECRASITPHRLRAIRHRGEPFSVARIIRRLKAGTYHCVCEAFDPRDADRRSVQSRTAALARGKAFV